MTLCSIFVKQQFSRNCKNDKKLSALSKEINISQQYSMLFS